jgi:two-component system, chemotaxis family, chemotaxis protein CheV
VSFSLSRRPLQTDACGPLGADRQGGRGGGAKSIKQFPAAAANHRHKRPDVAGHPFFQYVRGVVTAMSSFKSSSSTVLESNRAAGTRLELLLFRVDDSQLFGINVFKVQEIVPYTQLTQLPGSHTLVRGIANLRGQTMSILDLASAIGKPPLKNPEHAYIVVTEYNRSVHGFLIKGVEKIVNTRWEEVMKPPKGSGRDSYVTAVTVIDGKMVEILDVEKVLDQVVHAKTDVSTELTTKAKGLSKRVLIVDDSRVARTQISRSLEQIGVECVTAKDGKDAVELLARLQASGINLREHLSMIISDIEMPEMDGYQLTVAIRSMPALSDIYILLHSSISGEFNVDMVKKTGANQFIQKYNPDDLATAVFQQIGDRE